MVRRLCTILNDNTPGTPQALPSGIHTEVSDATPLDFRLHFLSSGWKYYSPCSIMNNSSPPPYYLCIRWSFSEAFHTLNTELHSVFKWKKCFIMSSLDVFTFEVCASWISEWTKRKWDVANWRNTFKNYRSTWKIFSCQQYFIHTGFTQ